MYVWLHIALPAFLEMLFLSAALLCVYRAQKNRIYPALWQFLIFGAVSAGLFLVDSVLNALHLVSAVHAYYFYFFLYWPSFLVNAILMLRVLHEMFRHSLRSVPGIQKLGRPIFFWAIAISVILATASGITSHQSSMSLLLASAQILMRSQSVLALCMLAFLAFASHALGVSFQSRIFGVTFGFALAAVGDLVYAALFTHHASLSSSINIVHEVVYLTSISIWCVYFLRPEPARRLVAMPSSSPLMRWNDIAETLGNSSGQVAVAYPPSFMNNVMELVNNVMGPEGWPKEVVPLRPSGPIAS